MTKKRHVNLGSNRPDNGLIPWVEESHDEFQTVPVTGPSNTLEKLKRSNSARLIKISKRKGSRKKLAVVSPEKDEDINFGFIDPFGQIDESSSWQFEPLTLPSMKETKVTLTDCHTTKDEIKFKKMKPKVQADVSPAPTSIKNNNTYRSQSRDVTDQSSLHPTDLLNKFGGIFDISYDYSKDECISKDSAAFSNLQLSFESPNISAIALETSAEGKEIHKDIIMSNFDPFTFDSQSVYSDEPSFPSFETPPAVQFIDDATNKVNQRASKTSPKITALDPTPLVVNKKRVALETFSHPKKTIDKQLISTNRRTTSSHHSNKQQNQERAYAPIYEKEDKANKLTSSLSRSLTPLPESEAENDEQDGMFIDLKSVASRKKVPLRPEAETGNYNENTEELFALKVDMTDNMQSWLSLIIGGMDCMGSMQDDKSGDRFYSSAPILSTEEGDNDVLHAKPESSTRKYQDNSFESEIGYEIQLNDDILEDFLYGESDIEDEPCIHSTKDVKQNTLKKDVSALEQSDLNAVSSRQPEKLKSNKILQESTKIQKNLELDKQFKESRMKPENDMDIKGGKAKESRDKKDLNDKLPVKSTAKLKKTAWTQESPQLPINQSRVSKPSRARSNTNSTEFWTNSTNIQTSITYKDKNCEMNSEKGSDCIKDDLEISAPKISPSSKYKSIKGSPRMPSKKSRKEFESMIKLAATTECEIDNPNSYETGSNKNLNESHKKILESSHYDRTVLNSTKHHNKMTARKVRDRGAHEKISNNAKRLHANETCEYKAVYTSSHDTSTYSAPTSEVKKGVGGENSRTILKKPNFSTNEVNKQTQILNQDLSAYYDKCDDPKSSQVYAQISNHNKDSSKIRIKEKSCLDEDINDGSQMDRGMHSKQLSDEIHIESASTKTRDGKDLHCNDRSSMISLGSDRKSCYSDFNRDQRCVDTLLTVHELRRSKSYNHCVTKKINSHLQKSHLKPLDEDLKLHDKFLFLQGDEYKLIEETKLEQPPPPSMIDYTDLSCKEFNKNVNTSDQSNCSLHDGNVLETESVCNTAIDRCSIFDGLECESITSTEGHDIHDDPETTTVSLSSVTTAKWENRARFRFARRVTERMKQIVIQPREGKKDANAEGFNLTYTTSRVSDESKIVGKSSSIDECNTIESMKNRDPNEKRLGILSEVDHEDEDKESDISAKQSEDQQGVMDDHTKTERSFSPVLADRDQTKMSFETFQKVATKHSNEKWLSGIGKSILESPRGQRFQLSSVDKPQSPSSHEVNEIVTDDLQSKEDTFSRDENLFAAEETYSLSRKASLTTSNQSFAGQIHNSVIESRQNLVSSPSLVLDEDSEIGPHDEMNYEMQMSTDKQITNHGENQISQSRIPDQLKSSNVGLSVESSDNLNEWMSDHLSSSVSEIRQSSLKEVCQDLRTEISDALQMHQATCKLEDSIEPVEDSSIPAWKRELLRNKKIQAMNAVIAQGKSSSNLVKDENIDRSVPSWKKELIARKGSFQGESVSPVIYGTERSILSPMPIGEAGSVAKDSNKDMDVIKAQRRARKGNQIASRIAMFEKI